MGEKMTGMKKLEGMPVIFGEKKIGQVIRGVLNRDGRSLRGLMIRSGYLGPRWLDRTQIAVLGKVSIIAKARLTRPPRDAEYRLFRVSDADGERIGIVTDALLYEETLRVGALEISSGPVDDVLDGRWYATVYSVLPGKYMGHVTVFCDGKGVKQ